MSNFIEMCMTGETRPDDIDNFVDEWHEGHCNLPIYDYLGMTHDEYFSWVKDPDVLQQIVDAYRKRYASMI